MSEYPLLHQAPILTDFLIKLVDAECSNVYLGHMEREASRAS